LLLVVSVGTADRRHLVPTSRHPRDERCLLVGRERDVRLRVSASPSTLSIKVVATTEVRNRRVRGVIHERRPVVFAGELGCLSRGIKDDVVGVARSAGAALM
jgi:hypothetical protein